MKRFIPGALALAVCLAACAGPAGISQPEASAAPITESVVSSAPEAAPEPSALPTAEDYAAALARELADSLITPAMTDAERVEGIYRYMVEKIYFAEPPAPDIWRWRCQPEPPPSYLHSRALGPLAYRVGSCEDFAAALTLTLREAGFPAEYVSGLTISAKREWVDHAWIVVKLGDGWYHLDSQLEQNVLKNGRMDYRYFLRDDEWMLADHLWGQWLASYWDGRQTPEQRRVLLDALTPPLCRGKPAARPDPVTVTPDPPDTDSVIRALEAEREAFCGEKTPLPTPEASWEPPLFSVMPR